MKTKITILALLINFLAIAQDGTLDTTFGTGGKVDYSIYSSFMDMQIDYNKTVSDYRDSLRFAMFDQTAFIDADSASIDGIVIAPGAILDIKTDTSLGMGSTNSSYKQATIQKVGSEFTFQGAADAYLERLKKMIGKDFKLSTWEKFNEILPAIKDYIFFKYQKKDISLNKLDYNFIEDFDYYLRTEKNNSQVTINKKIQRLKKVVKVARKQKLLDFNPFEEHKPKQAKTKIVFLTQDELDKLKEKEFQSEILNKVRDCYIFCCYTGLGYSVQIPVILTT